MLIDATYGRRTRAVVITDSEHVVLCAMQPETLAHRLDAQSDVDMGDADDASDVPIGDVVGGEQE